MFKTLQVLALLWGVGYFVIQPLNISGKLDSAGMITAIICGAIAFIMVAIPFLLKK